jgi:outer membrane protein OmpA-like peptidoglycan-associated protein
MFMAFNLIDSVKGIFGNELLGKAASMLGESEGGMQKAIGGIIPSILTGVLSKAGSGDAGGILGMAKDAAGSGILSNLGGLLGGGGSSLLSKGTDMLKGLFGDKVDNITSMISGFAGIKESSASSLMSMAAPAALGVLGKHASDTNMNASGLLSLLNSQKDNIMNALPSGLNLAGALGLSSLTGIGNKLSNAVPSFTGSVSDTVSKIARGADQKSARNRWIVPLLIAIVAIGLIAYLTKGCNGPTKQETVVLTDTVAKMADSVVSTVVAPVRESLKVKLPDGVELDAFKGGIEDQLVIFLNDPSSVAGKNVWFDFDNLNFKIGSADLTDESMKQVQNIAAILKAYPKVKIKIGGYTDKTGDSLSNIKLSKSRADAVVAALKTTGAEMSQVIGADGYGSQFAKVAADAPDEERKKDRRIAVSVRDK